VDEFKVDRPLHSLPAAAGAMATSLGFADNIPGIERRSARSTLGCCELIQVTIAQRFNAAAMASTLA